jgi:serine phosphatase RsbU (regulator of sigma subunit)
MIDSLNYERILVNAQGFKKWILWTTSKAPGNKVIGIGQDITERKKAEFKLLERNNELALRNKDIEESLHYARTIQESMLTDIDELKRNFEDSFVIYNPKDVVSGDFYFFHAQDNLFYAAAIDCTGHGVPGAMMSVLGHSLLKDIVTKEKLTNPKEIIERLDTELHLALNKNNDNPRSDGMDVALTVINRVTGKLSFCGAFRPLMIMRGSELVELKASRYPVGFYKDIQKEFTLEELDLIEDDVIYLFSDGYIDQFGGEKEKKFNKRNFKELLDAASSMTVEEQGSYLEYVHKNWKQDVEQTDDILVIGFRYVVASIR